MQVLLSFLHWFVFSSFDRALYRHMNNSKLSIDINTVVAYKQYF